jgi:hypothetical protein
MMIRGLSEHNRGLLVRSATVQVPEPYGPKSQAPPVPTSGYKWRGANVAESSAKKWFSTAARELPRRCVSRDGLVFDAFRSVVKATPDQK